MAAVFVGLILFVFIFVGILKTMGFLSSNLDSIAVPLYFGFAGVIFTIAISTKGIVAAIHEAAAQHALPQSAVQHENSWGGSERTEKDLSGGQLDELWELSDGTFVALMVDGRCLARVGSNYQWFRTMVDWREAASFSDQLKGTSPDRIKIFMDSIGAQYAIFH